MENFAGVADLMEKANQSPASSKQVFKPVNLRKAIDTGFSNMKAMDLVEGRLIKDLRTTDLNAYRMISFDSQRDFFRDEQTIFKNLCERNGVEEVTDLQIQWVEEHLGAGAAEDVNLNVDTFASETNSESVVRTQTLGFQGTKVKVRMLAQALGLKSPLMSINAKAREVRDAFVRLARLQETELLVNEEVTTEGLIVAPQMGGMITRSNLYATTHSGDLTNAAIQGRVDAIANLGSTESVGYGTMLVAFCPANQIAKIRDLMSSRYPGEASTDALAYQARLSALFGEQAEQPYAFKLYQPDPGAPVLFMVNDKMPASTVFFFDPTEPSLYRFSINGTLGPWGIERPTEALVDLVYCLDGISLRDSRRDKRATLNLT